jgi:ketosteroid isomerase-like protein
MKKFLLLALMLLTALAVFPQSKAEREVSDTVKQWADSIVSRDMDALGRILADDVVITDYNGKVRGKKEELEILKPSPDVKTVSVENEDLKIKVHGKTAVVTALTVMLFNIGGRDTAVSMRYTAVFVKRAGRWQIVALQTARVPGQNRER